MVCAQFWNSGFECEIKNEGARRSIKSAMTMTRAKQSHPARRFLTEIAFESLSAVTTITTRNKTSDS
jgi:hypothetical protein